MTPQEKAGKFRRLTIEFKLNGESVSVRPDEGETLLETLRERCGILSTKDGCQPQGQCGCCLAIVDGKAKVTCAMSADKAAGKDIVTLEGVPREERETMAQAFVAAAGLQCGFCIPGFALRAKHLLDKNPEPTRDEIAKAIDGNLCRCTGYVKIVDAIELMAKARRGEPIPEPVDDGRVGQSLARYQGADMTLSTARSPPTPASSWPARLPRAARRTPAPPPGRWAPPKRS